MSLIRIVVLDPKPRAQCDDLILYHVPEKSRAHELLVDLLDMANIEHDTVRLPRYKSEEISSD